MRYKIPAFPCNFSRFDISPCPPLPSQLSRLLKSMMMFVALMITALVGSASASFSIGCMTTLMNMLSDPNVACLNPSMLLPILISSGNDSLITPIDNWLTGMCASQACSSNTLSNVVTNLTAGCAAEFNLPPQSQVSQTVATVQKYYATARKVACLASGNKLCVTSELTLMQPSTGVINLSQSNVNSILLLGQFVYPPNITCTDCMHGAVTIINQDLPGVIPQASMTRASSTCGTSFVDGGIPPGLIETAVGLTTNNSTAPPSMSTYIAPSSTTTLPSTTPYYPASSASSTSSAPSRSSTSLSSLIFTSILLCTVLLVAGV